MCDQCGDEDELDEETTVAQLSPGGNWPYSMTSRMNWTDYAIVVTDTAGMLGQALTAAARTWGSILRAHSNSIAEKQDRQRFQADADELIEQLSHNA
jgi:hypothetical protein